MGRAWLLSALLHTGLGVLLIFGLPSLTRLPPAMERSIVVELVAEPVEEAPPLPAPPATAPEPERAAAAPEPTRQREPEPAPEPEPQVQEPPPPEPEPQPAALPEPEPPMPEPEREIAAPPEPEPAPEPEPQIAAPPEPAPAPEPDTRSLAALEPAPAPLPTPPERPAQRPQAAAVPKPRAKPEPPRTAAAPPPTPLPQPPQPAPERQPPPPQEDAFAALLKSVEQIERRTQAESAQEGQVRSAGSDGQARSLLGEARLSASEVDALRRQIAGCWTLPAGIEGIADMVVQLRIQVRPDRSVQRVTIQDQGRLERDLTFRTVAESARRAVDRCSPLSLPPDKYGVWRDIVMNFHPEDAIGG